jgi:hypothetical protein
MDSVILWNQLDQDFSKSTLLFTSSYEKPSYMNLKFIIVASILILVSLFLPVFSQNQYPVSMVQPDPVDVPSICLVTTSVNNKNVIVWEKNNSTFTGSYMVYRESTSQTAKWDLLGVVNYGDVSVFVDESSNPLNQAYNYRITAIDSCGNETDLSAPHKSMNLSIAQGINNSYSLIWSEYEGFTVTSYNIYRGGSSTDLEKIASTAAGNFNYNDNNAPEGEVFYQVEVISPNICDPSLQKSANTYSSSRSNIASNESISAISRKNGANLEYLLFPNPMKDRLQIKMPERNKVGYTISIVDLTGKKVFQETVSSGEFEFMRGDLPAGIYIIEIEGKECYRDKLIIND